MKCIKTNYLTNNNKYNTIQYNTIQYNTIQYNTIQYNTIQYKNKTKTKQKQKGIADGTGSLFGTNDNGTSNSLLTRFYGLYSLEMYGHTQYFVVMENSLWRQNSYGDEQIIQIHEKFDLKGSWTHRYGIFLALFVYDDLFLFVFFILCHPFVFFVVVG